MLKGEEELENKGRHQTLLYRERWLTVSEYLADDISVSYSQPPDIHQVVAKFIA